MEPWEWVRPVTLAGRVVRLEPLTEEHAGGMLEAGDPDILKYHIRHPDAWTLEGMREYIRVYMALTDYRPFAQVLQETGRAVGMTCYMEIRPPHRGLEIGSTWLGRACQGTRVNPEAKYLLLRHAFEELGAIRVQLKTDGRNVQSQRAIAKLGAQLEGVLRKHVVMPDGYLRDTVMFSITDDEWPTVKRGLEERLGYVPGEGSP